MYHKNLFKSSFMMFEKYFRWFLIGATATLLLALLYGSAGVSILLLLLIGFIVAQYFLKEKTILIFLGLRPLVDFWRDVPLVEIYRTKINVNSALAIMLLLWVIWLLYKYRHKILSTPLIYALTVFSGLILASIFYSFYPTTSLTESLKFLDVALLFITAYILVKNNVVNEKEIIYTVYLSAIIPITVGVYQFLGGFGVTTFDVQGRVFGTFAHPNIFAFYLLFLLLIHWLYSSLSPLQFWKKYPTLKIVTYATLIILLIFTYTRAAWVGLAIFFLIVGILRYRKALIITFITVGLLFAIFFPLNAILIDNFNINLQSNTLVGRLTSRSEDADSIAWRQSLITESVPLIREKILWGYGYGTFPLIWEANRDNTHLYDDSAEAHNDYLRLALEVGIIGLIIYVLLLIRLFVLAIKPVHHESNQPKHLFFFASIIVFFALSITDNMLHHTPVMWWLWTIWGMWAADIS